MWKQNDTALTTVGGVMKARTGLSEEEYAKPVPPLFIKGMKEAAQMLKEAISAGWHIVLFGDYDADGVTASAIFFGIMEAFGYGDYDVFLPDRETGYGLSTDFVKKELKPGDLLITVDNGITAIEPIALCRELGIDVVVIDHHIPGDELPDANVLVDPHADDESEYRDYCGAGLMHCLAKELGVLTDEMTALAAIGTVADVVPLIDSKGIRANHELVRAGLKAINSGRINEGLKALIRECHLTEVDEQGIGFSLAPCINAAGRLRTEGAYLPFGLLTKRTTCNREAQELREINEGRRSVTQRAVATAAENIRDNALYGDCPLVIAFSKADHVPVGLCGLVASDLVSQYNVPVFVLTEQDDCYKGSARACGNAHLENALKSIKGSLIAGGGHKKAAGLTVAKDKVEEVREGLKRAMADFEPEDDGVKYFDLEIAPEQIKEAIAEKAPFAPFGEGNRPPVYKIKGFKLVPKAGRRDYVDAKHCARYVSNFTKIQLFGANDITASLFDRAVVDKYVCDDAPTNLVVYGDISMNRFKASEWSKVTETPQVICEDYERDYENTRQSDLLEELHSLMRF